MSVYPWTLCDPSRGPYFPIWRPQCVCMRRPMPVPYTVALAKGLQSRQRAASIAISMGAGRATATCTSWPPTTHPHRGRWVQATRYTRATRPTRTTSVPRWQHRVLLRWMGPTSWAGASSRGAVHPPVRALLRWLHSPSVVVWRGAAETVALHMSPHGCWLSGASWAWRRKRRAVAAEGSVLALRTRTWQTAWGWGCHGGSGGVHRFGSHPCGLSARTHVLAHSTHSLLPKCWTHAKDSIISSKLFINIDFM